VEFFGLFPPEVLGTVFVIGWDEVFLGITYVTFFTGATVSTFLGGDYFLPGMI